MAGASNATPKCRSSAVSSSFRSLLKSHKFLRLSKQKAPSRLSVSTVSFLGYIPMQFPKIVTPYVIFPVWHCWRPRYRYLAVLRRCCRPVSTTGADPSIVSSPNSQLKAHSKLPPLSPYTQLDLVRTDPTTASSRPPRTHTAPATSRQLQPYSSESFEKLARVPPCPSSQCHCFQTVSGPSGPR